MSIAEKYIINTYLHLFERLSFVGKSELIAKLTKSLKKDQKNKNDEFFKSFGAFGSEKSADEISKEIKKSRNFNRKELKL